MKQENSKLAALLLGYSDDESSEPSYHSPRSSAGYHKRTPPTRAPKGLRPGPFSSKASRNPKLAPKKLLGKVPQAKFHAQDRSNDSMQPSKKQKLQPAPNQKGNVSPRNSLVHPSRNIYPRNATVHPSRSPSPGSMVHPSKNGPQKQHVQTQHYVQTEPYVQPKQQNYHSPKPGPSPKVHHEREDRFRPRLQSSEDTRNTWQKKQNGPLPRKQKYEGPPCKRRNSAESDSSTSLNDQSKRPKITDRRPVAKSKKPFDKTIVPKGPRIIDHRPAFNKPSSAVSTDSGSESSDAANVKSRSSSNTPPPEMNKQLSPTAEEAAPLLQKTPNTHPSKKPADVPFSDNIPEVTITLGSRITDELLNAASEEVTPRAPSHDSVIETLKQLAKLHPKPDTIMEGTLHLAHVERHSEPLGDFISLGDIDDSSSFTPKVHASDLKKLSIHPKPSNDSTSVDTGDTNSSVIHTVHAVFKEPAHSELLGDFISINDVDEGSSFKPKTQLSGSEEPTLHQKPSGSSKSLTSDGKNLEVSTKNPGGYISAELEPVIPKKSEPGPKEPTVHPERVLQMRGTSISEQSNQSNLFQPIPMETSDWSFKICKPNLPQFPWQPKVNVKNDDQPEEALGVHTPRSPLSPKQDPEGVSSKCVSFRWLHGSLERGMTLDKTILWNYTEPNKKSALGAPAEPCGYGTVYAKTSAGDDLTIEKVYYKRKGANHYEPGCNRKWLLDQGTLSILNEERKTIGYCDQRTGYYLDLECKINPLVIAEIEAAKDAT